jgi:hypothetical protein
MKHLLTAIAALALSACALNLGAPSEIDVPTAAVRVENGTDAGTVASALQGAGIQAAVVATTAGGSWFDELGTAASLHLSGPGEMAGLRMGFFTAVEAVGDTTIDLAYDGGVVTVHDALYEIEENRLLDILAFRMDDAGAFLEYVATDVSNQAAVVIAVAVPSAEVGDAVARMLSPGFYDARRCEDAGASNGEEIRLFYGPEARMFCTGAETEELADGELVRARLTMGRR